MNEMNIECWLDSFVISRRSSWTSIAKKPYKFVIFQGGGWGSGPTAPSLDPRMSSHLLMAFANSLDPDQARQNVGPDPGPNCRTL